MPEQIRSRPYFRRLGLLLAVLALIAAAWTGQIGLANRASAPTRQPSPLHPAFALLDDQGQNVLASGQPVSSMQTCGACHDTAFISQHSAHAVTWLEGMPAPAGETSLVSSPGGEVVAASQPQAGLEMNCFVCHTPAPNNTARAEALLAGQFGWAATATLLGSGIVEASQQAYTYNPAAFDVNGELQPDFVQIQDPTDANCGACHGQVHTSLEEPFVLGGYSVQGYRAALTGQVFSPQRLSDSGVNLAGKESLNRSWDVHAERAVGCTDCHYSLNNPVFFESHPENRPAHLAFDPRRLEMGEYLQQPLHQFAHGSEEASMRRCADCHTTRTGHTWLPYPEAHFAALSCETCHMPKAYAPAYQTIDWTVLDEQGQPQIAYRGVQGDQAPGTHTLITGYTPVVLPRQEADQAKAAPYNLVTSWYWVAGDPPQPVALADLQAAWLEDGRYPDSLLAAFDTDRDGQLTAVERVIDSPTKQAAVSQRLAGLGLANPEIVGQVQTHSVDHGVTEGRWVTRECAACHSRDSLLAAPLSLASNPPGGVLPELDDTAAAAGQIVSGPEGLFFQPFTSQQGLYVLGHNQVAWIDLFGSLALVGVLLAVAAHGGYRVYTAARHPQTEAKLHKVYMYSFYERLWHWLQTLTILLLLFTGLIIHKPDTFGIFSFRYVVLVHNVLAGILVLNAALSLFYHLASGEIRQYIPRPAGFFDQAILQAKFYLSGIFRREPHPFEKRPDKKLNPLQQVTYFAILNLLLPLQIITGALMWGAQRWPALVERLGGLTFLGPFHSLVAWLFASFIVAHVYLTTTSHAPLAGIQGMMYGWDEIEVHGPSEYGAAQPAAVTVQVEEETV